MQKQEAVFRHPYPIATERQEKKKKNESGRVLNLSSRWDRIFIIGVDAVPPCNACDPHMKNNKTGGILAACCGMTRFALDRAVSRLNNDDHSTAPRSSANCSPTPPRESYKSSLHPPRILPPNYPAIHVGNDNKGNYILSTNGLDLLRKHKFARYFLREQQSLDLFLGFRD